MMGNVELYHQYRWRELARTASRRAASQAMADTATNTPIQALGLGLIRLGARLAGPAIGRTAVQH
jgi:hypothetical protein